MNKKRTLAMLLAGAMLLPANAFAASPEDFTDFPTDWSAAGLRSAVQNGLLNGSNGQINSSGLLIRAQMAAIVNRAFAARKTADLSVYSDANTSAWYFNDLELAVAMRTFQGANGKLNPEAPITREEAFVVLARAFALEGGDTSVLNNYTDGASVSAWARSSVAALIENGYVNGANGKLNPKNSITRAEFAKVISEMASTYADADDSLSATVDGSVIVRENGVSLSGKTINGDLIIADGVSRIDLTGVTVTGRIVLRGGESGVTFKDTKAGKGVIANTDIAVSGSVDSITVAQSAAITVNSGASVGTIHVNAEGAKITGAGKVEHVKANANNVAITTSGTRVTAADSISGVKTGDKAVSAGKTETVGNTASGGAGGSTGGGSSSGGSSSGSGSSNGGSSSTVKAEIAKAQVVTTDAGAYLALSFSSGFTKENTVITVDGADVTEYATPVTDDGSIVKLPLVAQPGSVTLTSGSKTQTTSLGTKVDGAVYTGDHYLPDYFIKHGPLAIWDYYLTNYDDAGNARVLPSKTTFGTTAAVNPHPSYSPETVMDAKGNGTVKIMFNYTANDDQAWFENIADTGALELVSYDQYHNTLNNHLTYTKDTEAHHGSTVGTLNIALQQDNFRSNGRYYVRVCSTDENGKKSYTLAAIHVVNEAEPKLTLKETPQSGKNLHFEVSNLVYGITDPIEKVTLSGPVGANGAEDTIELQNNDDTIDYFLWSQDLFVLYNDESVKNGRNFLKYSGSYKLTIQANGFKTFSKEFTVNGGLTPVSQTAITLDAISRATGSSSSGGTTSSGGGYAISTNFLFKSDLVANACVLNDLNKSTSASDAVYEYWAYETSTLDSAFDTGDTRYFRGSNYYDKISTEGKLWIPFGDYRTYGDAVTTNPPGATKAVLEDGLLGDIQNSDVSGKLDFIAPTISDATEGSDVTLTFENGLDYLSKITALYLNGDWRELSSDYYTIDAINKTITIKKDLLHIGKNALKIVSGGYKAQEVKFTYNKATESGLSLSVADTTGGQPVVITINGSKGDFLKNLKSVVLTDQDNNKKAVSKQGVEGDTAIYYSIDENNTVIRLHNITKPGKYTLQLTADYYNELNTAFTMAGSLKKVPNATPDVSFANGIYSLDFGTVDFTWWNYVDSVTVNGKVYTQNSFLYSLSMLGDAEYGWFDSSYNSRILNLGASAFTEDQNTVVIRSTKDGYEDLTLTITKDGKLFIDGNDSGSSGGNSGSETPAKTKDAPIPTKAEKSMFGSYALTFGMNNDDYMDAIIGITVNDTPYTTSYNSQPRYSIIKTDGEITFDSNAFTKDNNTVIITATGYKELTVTITKDGNLVDNDNSNSGNNSGSNTGGNGNAGETTQKDYPSNMGFNYGGTLYFDQGGSNAAAAPYLNSITKITLNGKTLSLMDSSSWLIKTGEYNVKSSSTDKFIEFYSQDFSESENILVIYADGYKDMTLKVNKRGSKIIE
ncbi:DUF1533 domain-containing protein [Butyricicoccus sp. BIOML-A1]|nr:hemoblobin-interacting domain-containing protein [Butyricicoccus sp. BIOML-A1]MZT27621.1 DUF1533 domain-containing protein [Butyricicoccus sp. BIOML-A1]